MKIVILTNLLILLGCLFFYQFNNDLYNFIYFNPAQSLFRREHYLYLYLVGLILFAIIFWIVRLIYRKTQNDSEIRIFLFEFKILSIIGFLSIMVFIFYTYAPNYPDSNVIIPLIYIPVYTSFVWFYLLESLILLYFESRLISKRPVIEYIIKFSGLVLLLASIVTPVFIDGNDLSFSFSQTSFFRNYYYVFALVTIAYVVYFIQTNEKTKIVMDLIVILIALTVMIIPKDANDYYLTENYHIARPFISYYLLIIVILINTFDIFRLKRRQKNIIDSGIV